MATVMDRAEAATAPARITSTLARFVADTRFGDIPADVVRATRQLILDKITVTAAAMAG